MEAPTAVKKGWLRGFQLATYKSGSNQNQPITDKISTGMITHQTATALNLPVMLAPKKLEAVQTQSTTIVAMQT